MKILPLALATLLGAVSPAGATAKMVVTVLYFDNNSNDRQYDVLQKGLADMLITDLADVEALQVVEREKLEKLLGEMKLQRSRYFDPKTAQKLGQGLGAKYAVTGAFAALDPQMRIDIRLIEVASAKVIMADKVIGSKDKFFDLQQQLVQKFVAGLQVKRAQAESSAGTVDVPTLLKYSQGVDQADKGDLQAASKKLAEVVNDSPEFSLGKERYGAIVRRLREAGKRREGALESAEDVLLRNLDNELRKPFAQLSEERDLNRFLGYRIARSNYFLLKIKQRGDLIEGQAVFFVPRRRIAEVGGWMKDYFENTRRLFDELKGAHARFPKFRPDPEIDGEDKKRGEEIGFPSIGEWSFLRAHRAARALGDYTIRGVAPFWVSEHYNVRPSLAQIDPGYVKKGLELFNEARGEYQKSGDSDEDEVADNTDLHAEALVTLGRKEEAIAKWQSFLDAYPKHKRYKEFEKKIEDLLALGPEVEKFQAGVKRCDMSVIAGVYEAMNRVSRADGAKGVRRLLADIERGCQGNQMAMAFAGSAYHFAATWAAKAGDCALYDEILAKARKSNQGTATQIEQLPNGCR